MKKKEKPEPKKRKRSFKQLKLKKKNTKKPVKKKPGPNGKINKKQQLLIEIYCGINDVENEERRKLSSFLEAGYIGNKEKCIEIFNQPKIIKGIKTQYQKLSKERIETLEIPDPGLIMLKHKEKTGTTNRVSKLTEKRMKRIEQLARLGYPNKRIAQGVNISTMTFNNWVSSAEKAIKNNDFNLDGVNGSYLSFYYRLNEAKNEFEDKALNELLSRGYGYKEKKYTEKREPLGEGRDMVTERTETEIEKVDSTILKWLLERFKPNRFSKYVIDNKLVNDGGEERDIEKEHQQMLKGFKMLTKTIPKPDDEDIEKENEKE